MRKLLIIGAAALAVAVPALSRAAAAPSNLAIGAVATASSSESAQYPGSNAIDGDPTTRWSSAFSDPQTLTVDLGARASISDISLLWEASYGKAYTLEVSNDGSAWTQVAATDNSDGGTDDYPGLSATGRYVRMTGTARALPYGYSLYEFAVNGEFTETAVAPAASAYSMLEKDGTVTVPVRLNRASDSAVTVKYATADGTASAGKDYEAASGTLTFAPGETEKTIALHSIDDGVDEPNETFDLNFSDGSVTIGPRSKATVTVVDDDEATFDGKTSTVEGFEGTLNVLTAPQPPNNSGLFTFSNNAANKPTLTANPNPRPGSAGAQSMSVVANIASGGYGGFSDNLPASQDWSSYDGFSFWFKGTGTGHNLEFEVKDGGVDGEHSELWNSHVLDDSTAWKFVHLPFSAFTKRTDFQPSGAPSDGKLDLTAMWGYAMNLTTGANSFLIDDVQVYEQVRNVETFEGPATVAQRGFSVYNGNNAPPTLAIEPLARDGVTDNHALKVDYDTPAGQYGGYQQDFADTQDWSAFKGLRFWFFGRRTSASPATINIEIKDGGTGPGASELWTTSFLDDTQGWKLVTIPFSKFKYRTDYQPVGGIDHVLNLTKMWGYAVTPPAGDHGSFDFDDVQTYGVNSGVPDVSFATDKPVYLAHQGDTVNVGVTMTTVDGKPLADDQQVAYSTADDTAVAGIDYVTASGSMTFIAGTASGTTKTFPVTLESPAGASEAKRLKVTLGGSDTPGVIVIAAHGLPYLDSSLPVETRVNDLFSRMTTAEKIGQMTQAERLALDAPGDIASYNLGSILSGGGSTPTPNTPAGWQDMISGFQTQAMTTRLQIPLIYGADVVHGHNNVTGATLFPHNIGIGAAHDPSLGVDEGSVSAAEMKATGVPWAFAPCLCVARDERWGRTYESFGEDPALVIANEDVIDGLQDNGTLATAKHFAGDGGTTYGSSTQGSYTTDQGITPLADMAALHLPPFEAAIKQHHVGSVMPSYSSVAYPSGPLKMHANQDLLTGWLKQQEGFDGFVITDWQAIDQIPGNYDSDVVTSINAGIDMVMTPYEYQAFETSLTNAVSSGAVPLTRVDDAVKRILREKFRLGLFEHPFPDVAKQSDFGTAEHRAKARKAASESQVLLKNDGVLPLSKTAKLYVAGSNADDAGNQSGGWTISWQGGSGAVQGATTILSGMRSVAPGASITYSRDASASLSGYDAGVVVVGETPYAEGVGDVGNGHTLSLSAADRTAIDRVCGAMKCAVLVVSGRPMYDSRLLSGNALVASWLPGTEGAGVADTLFGDKPFTGRLPLTWARSEAQLPINVGDASYDPQFPYGWGLRTDVSARARLVKAQSLGATGLEGVLAADVWNADGSVEYGAQVLAGLRSAGHSSLEADDLVASVARDLAQAAMLRDGINSASSKLTSDAEHLLYVGDLQGAIGKLSQVALTSVSAGGGVGGTVPATLSLTLGPAASFGPLTAGVAKDYTAQTTANVISTAGDAALSASGPVHLANGAFTLPSALEVSFSKASWTGPVSNDLVTIGFKQHIGATDALRTGTYSGTVTFTLSTTTP